MARPTQKAAIKSPALHFFTAVCKWIGDPQSAMKHLLLSVLFCCLGKRITKTLAIYISIYIYRYIYTSYISQKWYTVYPKNIQIYNAKQHRPTRYLGWTSFALFSFIFIIFLLTAALFHNSLFIFYFILTILTSSTATAFGVPIEVVRWCVTSLHEKQKCDALVMSAPVFACVLRTDANDCIEAIKVRNPWVLNW